MQYRPKDSAQLGRVTAYHSEALDSIPIIA